MRVYEDFLRCEPLATNKQKTRNTIHNSVKSLLGYSVVLQLYERSTTAAQKSSADDGLINFWLGWVLRFQVACKSDGGKRAEVKNLPSEKVFPLASGRHARHAEAVSRSAATKSCGGGHSTHRQ